MEVKLTKGRSIEDIVDQEDITCRFGNKDDLCRYALDVGVSCGFAQNDGMGYVKCMKPETYLQDVPIRTYTTEEPYRLRDLLDRFRGLRWLIPTRKYT